MLSIFLPFFTFYAVRPSTMCGLCRQGILHCHEFGLTHTASSRTSRATTMAQSIVWEIIRQDLLLPIVDTKKCDISWRHHPASGTVRSTATHVEICTSITQAKAAFSAQFPPRSTSRAELLVSLAIFCCFQGTCQAEKFLHKTVQGHMEGPHGPTATRLGQTFHLQDIMA